MPLSEMRVDLDAAIEQLDRWAVASKEHSLVEAEFNDAFLKFIQSPLFNQILDGSDLSPRHRYGIRNGLQQVWKLSKQWGLSSILFANELESVNHLLRLWRDPEDAESLEFRDMLLDFATELDSGEWERLLYVQSILWSHLEPFGQSKLLDHKELEEGVFDNTDLLLAAVIFKRAGVKPNQTLIELGAGMGHVSLVAAVVFDLNVVAYENLNQHLKTNKHSWA